MADTKISALTSGSATSGDAVPIARAGTNYRVTVDSIAALAPQGTVTSVSGTGTKNGLTLTGTVTDSGNLTLGGTFSATSLEISDFNSATRAQTEAALIAGSNITITPGSSGATRTLTIAASGGGGSPGGATTQIQYNNAGVFAGASGITTNGTNLTVTGTFTLNNTAVFGGAAAWTSTNYHYITWNGAQIGWAAGDTVTAGSSHDTAMSRQAAGVMRVHGQAATNPGYVRTVGTTVASLPAASTAGAGARGFVTDANATTFNSVVAGGGSNGVPVFSDGTSWRIG